MIDAIKKHNDRFSRDEVWTKALRLLISYANPHFASISHLKYVQTAQLHVAASFIGCGRQDFMVQYGQSFYFHQTIADFRKEEISIKKIVDQNKTRILRNPDVFKHWQKYTDKLLDNCAECDFRYWKIPTFIKDKGDQESIQAEIRDNYSLIHGVFDHMAVRSLKYPCITRNEFMELITEVGIPSGDCALTLEVLDE